MKLFTFSRLARHKKLSLVEGYFDFILALHFFEESYFYYDLIKFLKKSGFKINGKTYSNSFRSNMPRNSF